MYNCTFKLKSQRKANNIFVITKKYQLRKPQNIP